MRATERYRDVLERVAAAPPGSTVGAFGGRFRQTSIRMHDHGPDMTLPDARYAINLVENAAGELLLLRRAPHLALAPGRWGFPAGHIEAGETPLQCAVRELAEECGAALRVRLLREFGPVRDRLYGGRFEMWLYHQHYLDGPVVLNHEHTAHAWVGRADWLGYDRMNGLDEDIDYLGIWPREWLDPTRLPA